MRRERTFIGPQGMAGMVSLWGASSIVRSVQHGLTTLSSVATGNTTTITAVNMDNSVILFLGSYNDNAGSMATYISQTYCKLTNSTTVTVGRYSSSGVASAVGWVVVEFAPGVVKPIQRVTLAIGAGSTQANGAITRVNAAKTTLSWGNLYAENTGADAHNFGWLFFTDPVTLSLARSGNLTAMTTYAEVVEFF